MSDVDLRPPGVVPSVPPLPGCCCWNQPIDYEMRRMIFSRWQQRPRGCDYAENYDCYFQSVRNSVISEAQTAPERLSARDVSDGDDWWHRASAGSGTEKRGANICRLTSDDLTFCRWQLGDMWVYVCQFQRSVKCKNTKIALTMAKATSL